MTDDELEKAYSALEKEHAALSEKYRKLYDTYLKIKEAVNDPELVEPPKPPAKGEGRKLSGY
ncbi:MAG: hypothetical protein HY301_07445 [Verrucomicrobia bacterium]|nr:hypothetical protein [Verrucomicrobiota bacterium]